MLDAIKNIFNNLIEYIDRFMVEPESSKNNVVHSSGSNKYPNQWMSREEKEKYLKSDNWKKLKRTRFEIAKYRCESCGYKHNLQLHHITYERLGDENIDDLVIVCRKCHERIHKRYGYTRAGYYPIYL